MRAGLSLFVAIVLLFFTLSVVTHAISSPLGISPKVAKEKIARREYDAIVDVRSNLEWALGHYPLAVHIPVGRIQTDLPAYFSEKRMRILFYCNTATRARWAAEAAQKMGYTNVEYLIGPHFSLY